jgi:SpoIID/LytB domain protein
MRDTPLTMTATGPASYYPGLPVTVALGTDPPVDDGAELSRLVGGAWETDRVPVPVVDGKANVTIYPGDDGQYQFRIGSAESEIVAMTPDASIPAFFSFRGAGWGHGVGMSQYGAASMARHGYNETQILTHYYVGSRVELLPVTGSEDREGDATVRVQVLGSGNDSKTDTTLRVDALGENATGAWTLTFFTASSKPILDGGTPRALTGTRGQDIAISVSGSTVTATANGVSASGSIAVLTWVGTTYKDPASAETALVHILRADGESASNGTYRHGKLVVGTAGGKRLNIVNVLKLNSEYLYGIAEVPSSWGTEALQAQAIAARNYAVANRTYRSSCDCQLYDDTRSQNFTGWTKESQGETGQWGARWIAAVDATSSADRGQGMMLTYGSGGVGHLVTAYYFSSSGGQTENSEDVWSAALSYTRSVADPWSSDPEILNINASWEKSIDQATVASVFDLPDVVRIEIVARTGPSTKAGVTELRATSSSGATSTITGMERVRTKLGLKSAWVRGIVPQAVEG